MFDIVRAGPRAIGIDSGYLAAPDAVLPYLFEIRLCLPASIYAVIAIILENYPVLNIPLFRFETQSFLVRIAISRRIHQYKLVLRGLQVARRRREYA